MKNFLYLLLLITVLWTSTFSIGYAAADQTEPLQHHISLSFDLEQQLVRGTSHITIPVGKKLFLACGPLAVTGTVLDEQTGPPEKIKLASDNTISIAATNHQRQLYLSWELHPEPYGFTDNLVSKSGITLAGFWHPTAESKMMFSIDARLPDGFSAITEGGPMPIQHLPQNEFAQAHIAYPLHNIHFVAGPYVHQKKQLGKLTLHAFFFKQDQHLATDYLKKTAEYIQLYQELIGPFPYPSYSIVENRLPTGYGMQGFTLLGQQVVRLPFIKDTSLGHEVLHSWFGNSVGVDSAQGNWAEGLTTYMADHYFASKKNQGRAFRKNQLLKYHVFVTDQNPIALGQFTSASHQQPMAKMSRTVGYDKGAFLFHMLSKKIGWDTFMQGLQIFYGANKHREAGWQELEHAFSQAAETDLSPFFAQWLQRTDIPELDIEQIAVRQEKGQSVVSFDLVQAGDHPYELDVTCVIQTLGEDVRKTITTSTLQKRVAIRTNMLPTQLIMDPDYNLMRRLGDQENVATWSHFLGSPNKNILVSQEQKQHYQPLIENMLHRGATLHTAKSATNQLLQDGDWLFLGDTSQRSSIFATPARKGSGFNLDVHFNPLNQNQVIVLVDSSAKKETEKVIRKLSHYGKYSSLSFLNGHLQKKKRADAEAGRRYPLLTPPDGVPAQATQSFATILERLREADVVYVGETHTDYAHHLLQLQVIQGLFAKQKNLVIGMEMFPGSSQQALDDYIVNTTLSEPEFLKQSQYFKVWGFDYRLYREIIQFAQAKSIPVLALNLDKKVTNTVFRTGSTDTLTKQQQAQAAKERDLTLPGYQKRLHEVHSIHQSPHGKQSFSGFLQAQAIWDETMAESIVRGLEKYPDHLMVVLAGSGHVDKQSGIPPRVKRRKNGVRQYVVVPEEAGASFSLTQEQSDYYMETVPSSLPPAGKIGVVLDVKDDKVSIGQISAHGQAGKAGLQVGDIITTIDDNPVTSVADIKISLLDKEAGETVTVHVERNGKPFQHTVELSSMQMGMVPFGHSKISKP
ncbi:MAG: hypothetical protein CSA31_01925 [Desulfobulbus propionicus]|nr:MAG: hypothetical protein CSB34_06685 [Desulfobulbus propionicus]PIE60457.1 MAG: hypothetical protein CSA31_01925 [Desulfobulbus propionicus]